MVKNKKVYLVRLLYVGGNANNGSICGLSCSNANNAFSNSNANIGARLKFIFKEQIKSPMKTAQLGGNKPIMRKKSSIPLVGSALVGVKPESPQHKDESHS